MKYIDAEKLKAEMKIIQQSLEHRDVRFNQVKKIQTECMKEFCECLYDVIDSLQQKQDRMRYCIEYINPQYPLLDNGELNIRHLRIPDEHGAEMALTIILSFGTKIYALYRGNVKDGKLGEWPTPFIVEKDDWYSADWLKNNARKEE